MPNDVVQLRLQAWPAETTAGWSTLPVTRCEPVNRVTV